MTAAEAVFLASLPTGRDGQPLRGHTRWQELGPEARARHERMSAVVAMAAAASS